MRRTHARAGRVDALANAGGIDRDRRRFLEDARAGSLRIGRQTERVIERMNVDGAGKMQRAEIALVRQHLAHALRRPGLDIGADPAQPLDLAADLVAIVGLRDMQPAGNRIDSGHAGLMNRTPHIVEALFRQRPELLGVIEPDALDHAVDILLKARQHEAGIAPGCRPGHPVGLQYRHRPAAPRHLARHGQARQPGADHADIDVEI